MCSNHLFELRLADLIFLEVFASPNDESLIPLRAVLSVNLGHGMSKQPFKKSALGRRFCRKFGRFHLNHSISRERKFSAASTAKIISSDGETIFSLAPVIRQNTLRITGRIYANWRFPLRHRRTDLRTDPETALAPERALIGRLCLLFCVRLEYPARRLGWVKYLAFIKRWLEERSRSLTGMLQPSRTVKVTV